MEFIYFVNLIFIFVVNIMFLCSGICLNTLVIVSFWRSVQLRKKLCYFTIIILSCCDLLVVLTNHPFTSLTVMLWLTEKISVYPEWIEISNQISNIFICSSLLALFVMSFDQYLATHYPFLHRTSVTKGKLLTLFTFLSFIQVTVLTISVNDLVIPFQVGLLVFGIMFIPPLLLINYKLFIVARKSRRNNEISPEIKKLFSLKNISSCLLVVVCVILLLIPNVVYIIVRLTSKETENSLDNAGIIGFWAKTTASMNSTFNCLIFFWKNKTLRAEGMKVIKSMNIRRKANPVLSNLSKKTTRKYEEKGKDV